MDGTVRVQSCAYRLLYYNLSNLFIPSDNIWGVNFRVHVEMHKRCKTEYDGENSVCA